MSCWQAPIPRQSYRLIIAPVENYRLMCAVTSHLENHALKNLLNEAGASLQKRQIPRPPSVPHQGTGLSLTWGAVRALLLK